MFCRNCGKQVENDWVRCPYCGSELSGDFQTGESVKPIQSVPPVKKRKKKWVPLVGVAVVLLVFLVVFAAVSGDGDKSYPDAENLVKHGTYGAHNKGTMEEVLEYCWKDGIWDSFQGAAETGKEALIVEYAQDPKRNTMVQFAVDLEEESFTLVHFERDGKPLENQKDGNAEIEKMYQKYFSEKYPIHDIDLADYVGETIEKLLQDSPAFYEADKDFPIYEDMAGQVIIMLDDENKFLTISVEGDGKYAPMFAGNRIGGSISEINVKKLKKKGYTLAVSEDQTITGYGNPENRSAVMFKADEGGGITSISWGAELLTDDMLEEMAAGGEEEQGTDSAAQKEEIEETAEYIFPDSDSRYLSEKEVRSVGAEKLAFGRNEIYARHGYAFKDPIFKEYFEKTSWYQGTVSGGIFDDAVFNNYERENLALMDNVEKELTSPAVTVNYEGGYIDGTDDDSNYIVMTQNGEYISYEWYCGGELLCSEENLKINEDGSVYGAYWNFWLEEESVLKVYSGVEGTENAQTFCKISGEGALQGVS